MSRIEKIKDSLNAREIKVLSVLAAAKGKPMTIKEMADESFPKRGSSSSGKGNSWVRNQLRALRDEFKLARKVERGTYIITKRGAEVLAMAKKAEKAADKAVEKAEAKVEKVEEKTAEVQASA